MSPVRFQISDRASVDPNQRNFGGGQAAQSCPSLARLIGDSLEPKPGLIPKFIHYESDIGPSHGWTLDENDVARRCSRQPPPLSRTPGILQESDRRQTLSQQFSS